MASLSKMMTLICVNNLLKKYNIDSHKEKTIVSGYASSIIGTSAKLKRMDEIIIHDLLFGLMLPSGNDAALVLAQHFGQIIYQKSKRFQKKLQQNPQIDPKLRPRKAINIFVKYMNRICQKYSLQETQYLNPHGLSNKINKSTCYEQALISQILISDSYLQTIVKCQNYKSKIYNIEEKQFRNQEWNNTNKMLEYQNYYGLKTGITTNAGPCLSVWYKNQTNNFIIILMSSTSQEQRWDDTQKLVEWGNLNNQKIRQQRNFQKNQINYKK